MNEASPSRNQLSRTLLIIWAVAATLIGILSVSMVVFLFVRLQSSARRLDEPALARETAPAMGVAHLTNVFESTLPGSYHWIMDGKERGIVTLYADHTASGISGEKSPRYRWFLQPQGLVITWGNSYTVFTESAGTVRYRGSENRYIVEMIKME